MWLQLTLSHLQKRQPNAAIWKWWMSPSMSSLEDITLTINQSLQKRIQDTCIHIYIHKIIQGKMHDIPCQQTATYMTMTSLQKKCTPKEWNNIREATWAFPKWYVYIYIYVRTVPPNGSFTVENDDQPMHLYPKGIMMDHDNDAAHQWIYTPIPQPMDKMRIYIPLTIWLFNIAMENPPIFKFGIYFYGPSNQRVLSIISPINPYKSPS